MIIESKIGPIGYIECGCWGLMAFVVNEHFTYALDYKVLFCAAYTRQKDEL